MKKRHLAYCLLLIELVIQIVGSIYYKQTPQEVWSLSNAILFMVPLAFGIRFGLLCLIPVAISEIVWFCKLGAIGPLLHLFAFAVTVIVLGLAGRKLKHLPTPQRVTGSCILYELSLLGEEALYYASQDAVFESAISMGRCHRGLSVLGKSAGASLIGVLLRKRSEIGRRKIKTG